MILLIVWLRLKIKDGRSNGSTLAEGLVSLVSLVSLMSQLRLASKVALGHAREAGKQALHLTVPVQLE